MPYKDAVKQKEEVRRLSAEGKRRLLNYVRKYKSDRGCMECGIVDPVVLDLHHVGGKDAAISRMVNSRKPLDLIKQELAKCVVLCANHHRLYHASNL